jgi:MSHA biogenesis protein MshN
VIVAASASGGKRDNVNRENTDSVRRIETDGKRNAVQTAAVTDETDADISKTEREPSSAEKSVNMYAHAMDMFSQGRTDESRLQLKQALVLDPSNSKASQLLAAIYLGDNRPELAVNVIDEGLKLRPADQDMLRLYLQIQVQMKNYAQAINIMERRMRLNTPEDIAYLAGLHQKNKDYLGAARLYAQALKLKPSNSVWWMGQGISFEALGMNEEAMKSYQQSIESGRLNTQLAEYVLGRIASIEKLSKDPVS